MNKLYSVHDHWTDIGKKNDVDIESIDGVITGIKVNGEDFGGESDFSTAEVTFINEQGYLTAFNSPILKRDMLFPKLPDMSGSTTLTAVLYKDIVYAEITSVGTISVSGNISLDESNIYAITGDCTITIS